MSVNRRCQCSFDGPSKSESRYDDFRAKTMTLGVSADAFRMSVEGNDAVVASVALLLFLARPPAVFGRIPLCAVQAFYRHAISAFAHVRVEIGKCEPTLAHLYALGSVGLVRLMFWVGAALKHSVPCPVAFISLGQPRESMCSGTLYLKTSTTLRVPVSQIARSGHSGAAAFAGASPYDGASGATVTCVSLAYDYPTQAAVPA